jgi:hypothetical protein
MVGDLTWLHRGLTRIAGFAIGPGRTSDHWFAIYARTNFWLATMLSH